MLNTDKIRHLMKKKDIRSKDLAAKIGISESMMSFILSGLREPSVQILVRIAKTLECSVDDIIMK